MTTNPELIAELKQLHSAAWDAWRDARPVDSPTHPQLAALAFAVQKLEGELRLARAGISRKALPAGTEYCDRCGGYGGSSHWPGYVCFDCDGRGTKEK